MSLANRILLRDGDRNGRLRDYRGNKVSFQRLLRNGPRAGFSAIGRLAFGHLPKRPWIAYDGQTIIDRFLNKSRRVLEFGSGTSTAWYARRAGEVVSLEDNKAWHKRIESELNRLGNVDYRYCDTLDEYLAISHQAEPKSFDFIMIDGTRRDACLDAALPLLAPGGLLYLDNSDMFGDHVTGDVPRAREKMFAHANSNGARIETITDFAPTQLFVNEATLLFNDVS